MSEMWIGPCVAMIQSIYPAELVGAATALFCLSGGISGASSTLILGILGDSYHSNSNPNATGYLLTILVGISYLG